MFEYILKDYASKYNFNYSILRYFNACGSDPEFEVGEYHKNEKRIIPCLIKFSLGLIDKMYIFGNDYDTIDGTAVRDYTHVCDIASAHIKTFEYMIKNNKNVICNIGTGKGHSIKEIISIIENISNKKLNIEIKERRTGDSGFMVCSNEYAKKTINWEPKYNIYDIIKTAYEWYNVHLPLIKDKIDLENNVIENI
jgi:UDP-glucose 4-epimerase